MSRLSNSTQGHGLKITQEVYEQVKTYIDELNVGIGILEYPDEEYTVHFFENDTSLDDPWVSIDFGHNNIEAGIILELKKRFPDAVIYISGVDSNTHVSLHEKTYEQMEKERKIKQEKEEHDSVMDLKEMGIEDYCDVKRCDKKWTNTFHKEIGELMVLVKTCKDHAQEAFNQ